MRSSKDAEGQKVLVCNDVVCRQQDLGRDKIPRSEDQNPPQPAQDDVQRGTRQIRGNRSTLEYNNNTASNIDKKKKPQATTKKSEDPIVL